MAHHHHHDHQKENKGERNIAIAFTLNFLFTIVELVGGILTNSVAIQSDALHDAGDTISLGIAWYFQRLSRKKPNHKFTFGYKRFNTVGAMITGTILVAGSVYILSEAIPRLLNPEEVHVKGMIWLAILGIVINGAAVINLRKGSVSLNEEMISWHLIEDMLGWLLVLIGSVLIYFYDLLWIDALLSVIITLYILINVIKNLVRAGKIILQAAPDQIDLEQINRRLLQLSDIEGVHHMHCWTMDGVYNLFSAHIVTPDMLTIQSISAIRNQVKSLLEKEFNIHHTTLEFENNPCEDTVQH